MSNQTPETFQTFEPINVEAAPAYEAMPEMAAMPEMGIMPEESAMPSFDSMYTNLPDGGAETAKKPKQKKNWFVRLFAFLLAVGFLAIYFLVDITHLASDGSYSFQKTNYFEHMLGLFTTNMNDPAFDKLFGILPTHFADVNGSVINQAITIIMYLLPVALVVCFFFGVIALFSKKAACFCLRFIAGTQFVFSALLLIAMVLVAAWYDGGNITWTHGLDPILVGIAGGTFLIYVIASIVKAKGWAVLDLFIFLLSAVSVAAIAYGIVNNNTAEITKNFLETNEIYNSLTLILIAADIFFLICALIGIPAKKLYGIDLVRAIFMTAVGGFLVFLSLTVKTETYDLKELLLPSIVAAGSAFLMLVIEAITIAGRNSKKKAKKEKKAKKVKAAKKVKEAKKAKKAAPVAIKEAPANEFATVAAPAANVEEAAIVAPTATAEEAPAIVEAEEEDPAALLDAFLVSLSKKEKEEFGVLTLKLQKIAPDIPRYETGAENKIFFRRIFVNLGSVRGLISDELMEKIYQHTIQL